MDPAKLIERASALEPELRAFRRHLHSHPELSFGEHETARFIKDRLEREGIGCREIASTGVLAIIPGAGNPESCIVLRADIDALPICENNDIPYKSGTEGVMHACGHDMHAAALYGALIILNEYKGQLPFNIYGVFQPGEELCPGGATLVLAENPFAEKVTAVIGQHIEPELPTGTFGLRAGKYMASSDEIRITVKGKGGHAALQDKLEDPVIAASQIILSLQQIVSRNCPPRIASVLSIGKVIADGATNVIPDQVYLEGTFRTFDEQWREAAKKRIKEICENTATACGTQAVIDIRDGYPCVVNSPQLACEAENLFKGAFREENVVCLEQRPTAEDFGYYTRLYPSLFYRFGAGGSNGYDADKLHTATFLPDEKSLVFATAGLCILALGLKG